MNQRFHKTRTPNDEQLFRKLVRQDIFQYPRYVKLLKDKKFLNSLTSNQYLFLNAKVTAIASAYKNFLSSPKGDKDMKERVITDYFWSEEKEDCRYNADIARYHSIHENTVYNIIRNFVEMVVRYMMTDQFPDETE